jgi:hypothetical protein
MPCENKPFQVYFLSACPGQHQNEKKKRKRQSEAARNTGYTTDQLWFLC